jgi:hypothetical protein
MANEAVPDTAAVVRRPITPEEALRLLRKLQAVPRRALAQGARSVVEDPAGAAAAVGKAGLSTVSATAAPLLHVIQEGTARASAGMTGAIDPLIDYLKNLPGINDPVDDKLRSVTQVPEVVGRSLRQAKEGVMEKKIPFGTAETAWSDLMRKQGFKEPFFPKLPDQMKRGYVRGVMGISGLNPEFTKAAADVTSFVTGPEGAGLAADIVAGDGINKTMGVINKGYKETGASRLVSKALDPVRAHKLAAPIVEAFSHFGKVPYEFKDPRTGQIMVDNAREKLNSLLRQYVGEKGAEYYRLAKQISGGKEAIEEGARVYKMLPEERSKFLEVIYENQGKGGFQHIEELVKQDIITDAEADC